MAKRGKRRRVCEPIAYTWEYIVFYMVFEHEQWTHTHIRVTSKISSLFDTFIEWPTSLMLSIGGHVIFIRQWQVENVGCHLVHLFSCGRCFSRRVMSTYHHMVMLLIHTLLPPPPYVGAEDDKSGTQKPTAKCWQKLNLCFVRFIGISRGWEGARVDGRTFYLFIALILGNSIHSSPST